MEDSEGNSSVFLRKEPCPSCGSSDNLARYSDGHGHCFGCGHYEHGEASRAQRDGTTTIRRRNTRVSGLIENGEVKALNSRKINAATCQHFNYTVGRYKGKPAHVAPYYDADGELVAQHLRTEDKEFPWLGESKQATMFGQNLWRDGGKMVVVTEGEIDCMSVSQMQGNKWPVVSIGCGAGEKNDDGLVPKVERYVAKHVEWLEKFETVVFCFDTDDQGKASAIAAASVLSPGKAKIAHLPAPFKDANEMLVAGKGKELLDAIWGAKEYRPDGIVTLADLKERVLRPVEWGLPWPWETLTKLTYGRRTGEVYAFGAGTGVGKTDTFMEIASDTVEKHGQPVALFFLEQEPTETGKRLAGKIANRRFHVPDAGWTQEELAAAWDKLIASGKVYLYDHFGSTDWSIIRSRIRYLAKSEGVKHFFIDHLTALAAAEDDERKALEQIMADMGGLVKELDIAIYLISHLATPEGKPHEEGGRVMIRHFKGSRAIGFWCHYMFGLERNQQAASEKERQTTTFRVLKDRYTGQATGETFLMGYDAETGRLYETQDSPFEDESRGSEATRGDQDF